MRHRIEIIYAILSILREGPVNHSGIQRKASLSGTQITRYGKDLKATEMITTDNSTWRISPKGVDYCISYERLATYLQ